MNTITRKLRRPGKARAALSWQNPGFSIRPTLLAIAIAQALTVPSAQAATIVVDDGGDGLGCTLRDALTSINNGGFDGPNACSYSGAAFGIDDQIRFSVATVSLSHGELDIDKNLTINGGAGVTINANGFGRLFRLDAVGTSITLDNLTLTGGIAGGHNQYGSSAEDYHGGAILVKGVNLTLSNSTVSGNSTGADYFTDHIDYGGGIFAESSHVSLSNSTVSGNSAYAFGGGIGVLVSNVSLDNSTVSGNRHDGIFAKSSVVSLDHSTVSNHGDLGIDILSSNLSLSDSTLSGNQNGIRAIVNCSVNLSNSTVSGNDYYGHGISASNNSSVNLSNSAVSGSHSGITVGSSNLSISNSTVSENHYGINAHESSVDLSHSTVSGNVSGISALFSSNVGISNSTVSNNTPFDGYNYSGGISVYGNSTLSLSNSTVSGNAAYSTYSGGGLSVRGSSSVSLNNSIVANSDGGPDCYNQYSSSSITANNQNIIEDGSCATAALSVDPKLGPLADNGGPTKTHTLLAGSTAINTGDNAVCAAAPVNNLDQRGEIRPVGNACDLGAYESEFETGATKMVPLPDGKGGYFFISL